MTTKTVIELAEFLMALPKFINLELCLSLYGVDEGGIVYQQYLYAPNSLSFYNNSLNEQKRKIIYEYFIQSRIRVG